MQLDLPSRLTSKINITPLIDVVFILLMFFMLATRFDQYRVLEINSSVGSAVHVEENQLVVHQIALSDNNLFSLDGQQLSIDELEPMLASMQLENPQIAFDVFSKTGSRVQQLVSVIDVFNRLEINRVELQIE